MSAPRLTIYFRAGASEEPVIEGFLNRDLAPLAAYIAANQQLSPLLCEALTDLIAGDLDGSPAKLEIVWRAGFSGHQSPSAGFEKEMARFDVAERVVQVIEQLGGKGVYEAAITQVATKMGRSKSWVQKRATESRMSKFRNMSNSQ